MWPPSSDRLAWSIRLVPYEGEPLSAWLARSARAHGQSLHRFGVDRLHIARLAIRDVDVHATPHLLEAISEASGVSIQTLATMTVPRLGSNRQPARAPWVLPSSAMPRSMFRFGKQACLDCVAGDRRTYPLSWRFAFVVACERHGRWLVDACPVCEQPLGDHTATMACRECHSPWISMTPMAGPFFSQAVALQRWILHAIGEDGHLKIDGRDVPIVDALAGFRFLVRLDRRIANEARRRIDIERLRIRERIAWLDRLASVLERWPAGFLEDAKAADVSRHPFKGERCPDWVADALGCLRPVRARSCATAKRHGSDDLLAFFKRKKPRNWRSRYAYRMCKLVGALS